MAQSINYGNLMHDAMCGLIKNVLEETAKHGLPGDHHFFITIDTRVEGVQMADWLLARYPQEITIVVQNWFDNLVVDDDGFSITLNFGDTPEPMYIPFNALITFVDPSVEFGLRFESSLGADDETDDDESAQEPVLDDAALDDAALDEPAAPGDAQVVELDHFRKR